MTVNCRSIKDKRAEFETALHYLKPDIICATESWLKGVKPGVNPTKDAIKSSEIFPPNYNVYRNNRRSIHTRRKIYHLSGTNIFHHRWRNRMGKNINEKQQRPTSRILLYATQRTKTP
jgi:hypothetical protein